MANDPDKIPAPPEAPQGATGASSAPSAATAPSVQPPALPPPDSSLKNTDQPSASMAQASVVQRAAEPKEAALAAVAPPVALSGVIEEIRPPAAEHLEGSITHSAMLRNVVHAGVFSLALLVIPLVDPRNNIKHGAQLVVGFMLFGTLFNLLVLPHMQTGKKIARPGEGFISGQWLYPLALAICFAVFPPFAAMGAWAAMAGGDAAASFFGRMLPFPKLPWNHKKTWTGFAAFVFAALLLCFGAMYWCPSELFLTSTRQPELAFVWTLAVLAAVSGAVFESLRGPLDDNLRVPLGVGAVLWLAAWFLSYSTRNLPANTPVQPENFLVAIAVNVALGFVVLSLKFSDLPGMLLGVALGTLVYFFAQWQGYLLFGLMVLIGSVLTKVGMKTKESLGTAEKRAGKRGAANVAANLLGPALCCLAYPNSGSPVWLMAFAGAVAAALADTAGSELGPLFGGQPVLITTRQRVPHGANGAVSAAGLAAAVASSVVIAVAAWSSGFFSQVVFYDRSMSAFQLTVASFIVVIAGLAGTLIDSLLGATIESRWTGVGKGTVNFICTLVGAFFAGGLTAIWIAL
jgi:uncharacterized protein (TIGR00297 family)